MQYIFYTVCSTIKRKRNCFPLSLDTPSQNGRAVGGVVGTSADVDKDHRSCASVLQDSSFEVISLESR